MRRRSILILCGIFIVASAALAQGPAGPDVRVFADYREKLAALIPDGVAVLEGREYGWLTGVYNADAKLIFVPPSIAAQTPAPEAWKTTLYLPPKDPRAGVWDDPRLSYGDDVLKATGLENSAPQAAFSADIARLSSITNTVYVPYRGLPLPSGAEIPATLRLYDTVVRLLPGLRIKNLAPILDDLRWAKHQAEVEIMRRSCAITAEAFMEAARLAAPRLYESDLDAAASYVMRRHGAQHTFLIIGAGPNSCVLHHSDNDRRLETGDMVVIDIGNTYGTMGTDLTRTIPASGRFTAEQRKVYDVVLEAQRTAIAIVKPGVTLAEVHRTAREVIERAGFGKYFIHGTSHTLNGGSAFEAPDPLRRGLLYKPDPRSRYAADNRPAREGTMFTIEPGIYIPERNLGVRIEDSILVTKDGCEILTGAAPKDAPALEKLMREGCRYVRLKE